MSVKGETRARQRWTAEEDKILLDFVEHHGPCDWKRVAQLLPNRDQHHARLRYSNYLSCSSAASRPFTPDEDQAILQCAKSPRPRWSHLAKSMNRGDTVVKNRYFLLCRRLNANKLERAHSNQTTDTCVQPSMFEAHSSFDRPGAHKRPRSSEEPRTSQERISILALTTQ
mmetsp:Transcript_14356/g.30934  ORF Transcript_14356/g.30934 Transcript_14356/m.30934 type:complete len:170 (+) Transcript_14356:106-615(+)